MRVPPLAQLALCFAIAGSLAVYFPIMAFDVPMRLIALEVVAGFVFLLPAIVSFVRNRTTVNPQSPREATTLVTGGIYSISRNPMYVGMLLILIGFVLWLGQVSALITIAIFFFSIDRFQIRVEEKALRANFGEAFEDYALRVPRWLIVRNG